MQKSSFKVLCCAVTDVGYVRQQNEDATALCPEKSIFIIADGMGGHNAGEVAAKYAVEELSTSLAQKMPLDEERMDLAFHEVNSFLYQKSQSEEALAGMGTTLAALVIQEKEAFFAHVGDSRIYLYRKGSLRPLTKDHTLVNEMLDLGALSPEAKELFPYKHILTCAMGTAPFVSATVGSLKPAPQDVYLLATDGLVNELSDAEIETLFQTSVHTQALENVATELVERAKAKGGSDNITVILVRIDDLPG